MINPKQYRRLAALATVLVLLLAGLIWRLVDLQVVRHSELSARGRNNTHRIFHLEPRRGDILDARGNQIATSVFVKTVCANPAEVKGYGPELARVLAPLLQKPEAEILQKLQPRAITNTQGKIIVDPHVVLQRSVSLETWQQITQSLAQINFGVNEKKLPLRQQKMLKGVRASIFCEPVDDQLRVYRNRELACHVLGFVGVKEVDLRGKKQLLTTGLAGLELSLNHSLTGVRGWKATEIDSRRRELVAYRDQNVQPQDGLNAVLTLDLVIQHIVETELAEAVRKHSPTSICATVIRPETGEILAMAVWPNYDPNAPGKSPIDHLRNRVISDSAEPGSTFKVVVIAAALNEGLITLRDQFDCENGIFYYGGRPLRDFHHNGVLSVQEILAKSSNIGAAKIGLKLGEDRLHRYITDFGFGRKTGLGLSSEQWGMVHPVKNWNKLSITRVPMGHEVSVTPLQMAMAMSAIANGGKLMRPMLVQQLQDQNGQVVSRYYPQVIRRVVEEGAARQVTEALKSVVSTNGSGGKAGLEHYQVAGKTGTAQKLVAGQYVRDKDYSSFVGFFPANSPKICISVVVDEPKNGATGGSSAAPVFKNIAERVANYLNIAPDQSPPEPMLSAGGPGLIRGQSKNRP